MNRRIMLGRGLSVGAISLLTSCNLPDDDNVRAALARVPGSNDRDRGHNWFSGL